MLEPRHAARPAGRWRDDRGQRRRRSRGRCHGRRSHVHRQASRRLRHADARAATARTAVAACTAAHRRRHPRRRLLPAASAWPEAVEFEGTIVALTGDCPNISFIAGVRLVVTNGGTEFKKGRCRDLSFGDRVKVRGTTTPGSPVAADRVEIKKHGDDD